MACPTTTKEAVCVSPKTTVCFVRDAWSAPLFPGTSKVPLQGFAALEGMTGVQKFQIHRDDRSTSRLPCAHTW